MGKKYQEYTDQFNFLGYNFRLNGMNNSIESNCKRLDDIELFTLESKMNDYDFPSSPGIKRNAYRNAGENTYHPIKDWLSGLVWDGDDHFGKMINYFTFEHSQIASTFIWRFLLGAIGKVQSDGIEQNYMLVFDSKQELGKSYWADWLVPEELKHLFAEGRLEPDNKDHKMRVISKWLWEVGELQGTTRKADLESLKNIITQKRMTVRAPYGRFDIDKPIPCSFIGTLNEHGAGFLNDVTGNRRFAIVKILDLDFGYSKAIDIKQLWAQVNEAYIQGERGKLTPEEKRQQNAINADYDTMSHVEQFLLAAYEVDIMQYANNWIPAKEIIGTLEQHGLGKSRQRAHFMELAGIITKMGGGKSLKSSVTGYGRATCYSGLKQKTNAAGQGWTP